VAQPNSIEINIVRDGHAYEKRVNLFADEIEGGELDTLKAVLEVRANALVDRLVDDVKAHNNMDEYSIGVKIKGQDILDAGYATLMFGPKREQGAHALLHLLTGKRILLRRIFTWADFHLPLEGYLIRADVLDWAIGLGAQYFCVWAAEEKKLAIINLQAGGGLATTPTTRIVTAGVPMVVFRWANILKGVGGYVLEAPPHQQVVTLKPRKE
jgi:hypothetical protein